MTKNKREYLFETMIMVLIPMAVIFMIGVIFGYFKETTPVQAKMDFKPSDNNEALNIQKGVSSSSNEDEPIPNSTFLSSQIGDITAYAGNFRIVTPLIDELRDEKWVSVDLCYDLIDDGDWTIDNTYIVDARGLEASWVETSAIEIHLPPTLIDNKLKQKVLIHKGQAVGDNFYEEAPSELTKGLRCDAVLYRTPSSFDTSTFNVVIEGIISYPKETEQCSDEIILKMQNALDERNIDIQVKLKSNSDESDGVCGIEIADKPENISDEEARSIVYGHEMYMDLFGIRGPWVFEGTIP